MQNSDWYEARGGALSLFFGLCWLRLFWRGLDMLFTLLALILVPKNTGLAGIWLLFLLCMGAQCAIYVQMILGLSPLRRQRPESWKLWALCLLDWMQLFCYALPGAVTAFWAIASGLLSLLHTAGWDQYFSRSRRCAAYFGPPSQSSGDLSCHALCLWTNRCLFTDALKHAPPEPVFAALTVLLYGQDTDRQQQILKQLQDSPVPTLGEWSMQYDRTRQALEELNQRLRAPDIGQPEDAAARWVLEKTGCQTQPQQVRTLLEEAREHLRRQLPGKFPAEPFPPQEAAPAASPARKRRFCPNCGTPVREDAAFCPWCGQALKP